MKLYRMTHYENGIETITDIFASLESAEHHKEILSHSKIYCNGKEVIVSYVIEEFESETEPTFDVYILCSKSYYSDRSGRRISGMMLEKATEIYNKYSKENYVELQLPQKQFGSMGVTSVTNNCDDNYYSMKQNYWDKRAEEEEGRCYSPSNPWDAPGMSIKDFI